MGEWTANIEINCIMENRQQQILSEIKEMMSSIKLQLEQLDAKITELQYDVESQDFISEPIDIQLDDFPLEMPGLVIVEPVVETVGESDVESIEKIVAEPVETEVIEDDLPVENVETDAAAAEPQIEDDDLPFFDDAVLAEKTVAEVKSVAPVDKVEKQAVIDTMTAKQTWRTDMPGVPVRDIRSAISLNDRVLFINTLFNEDPVSFQDTLTNLNQMTSFDEAVNYLISAHPSWDLESDVIYRFMMALRRKIN